MKVYEIIEQLHTFGKDEHNYNVTCDTLKSGSPDAEVTKIAVTMNPTVDVIKKANDMGAQLLIAHEPLYYNHMDEHSEEAVESEKRALLESTGITVARFHDHPHYNKPDMIAFGQLRAMELDGEVTYTDTFDLVKLKLNSPLTPAELAKHIENKLGLKHIRIAGARDEKCTSVSAMFGAPGDVYPELCKADTEILIVGETCEWRCCEYARDAAMLGKKKAMLVLGHAGSEESGMMYICDVIKGLFPNLNVTYIPTGEVYTYTD